VEQKQPRRFKVAFIAGTRPEIIKTAPVFRLLLKQNELSPIFINTGQHRELSRMFYRIFSISPDYDLDVMKPGQSLSFITSQILHQLENVLQKENPDWVMVQGDTTSAFCGALSAFYQKIPVGHIEAGLRTGDKYNPFPEETNRTLISRIADLHFAPTQKARINLVEEGISQQKIVVTGNTVVDSLLWIQSQNWDYIDPDLTRLFSFNHHRKMVIITAHRRESWEGGIANISQAVEELASRFPDVLFLFSVHPNPIVKSQVYSILAHKKNVLLLNPLDYRDFIKILGKSEIAISDSGGVQEEAPSLGVPVIITRSITERPEILHTQMGFLTGTDREAIVCIASDYLTQDNPKKVKNVFGDGFASQRIIQALLFAAGKTLIKPEEFSG